MKKEINGQMDTEIREIVGIFKQMDTEIKVIREIMGIFKQNELNAVQIISILHVMQIVFEKAIEYKYK